MPLATPGKKFRLTPSKPPGAGPTIFESLPEGIRTPCLGGYIHIPYYPVQDAYSVGNFLIHCDGNGAYRGMSGGVELEGTCEEVPPP